MKLASVIIANPDDDFGILCIKGHESSEEAKLFLLDEIFRMADDESEDGVVKVTFCKDIYDERISIIEALDEDGETIDKTIVKCSMEDEC